MTAEREYLPTSYIVEVRCEVSAYVEVQYDLAYDSPHEKMAMARAVEEIHGGDRNIEWEWGAASAQRAFEAWAPCTIVPMHSGSAMGWCEKHTHGVREGEAHCWGWGEAERNAGLPVPVRMDGERPCWCRRDPGPVIHSSYCDNTLIQYPKARM